MSRPLVYGFVAGLLVGLVIAGGVALVAVSAERQRTAEARDDALEAEREAKDNERRAHQAEKEALKNLKQAEENLKLAKKAVNDVFDLAKNDELFQQPGMLPVRKKLMEKALPFYKEFRKKQ